MTNTARRAAATGQARGAQRRYAKFYRIQYTGPDNFREWVLLYWPDRATRRTGPLGESLSAKHRAKNLNLEVGSSGGDSVAPTDRATWVVVGSERARARAGQGALWSKCTDIALDRLPGSAFAGLGQVEA